MAQLSYRKMKQAWAEYLEGLISTCIFTQVFSVDNNGNGGIASGTCEAR